VVESETDGDDEDFVEVFENLTHKKPMVRVFALGKLNRILQSFENKKLSSMDRRLLKGFYVQNMKELQNEDLELHSGVAQEFDTQRAKSMLQLKNEKIDKKSRNNENCTAADEIRNFNDTSIKSSTNKPTRRDGEQLNGTDSPSISSARSNKPDRRNSRRTNSNVGTAV